MTLTNDAPDTFPIGTTTVTWTATDANGNMSTATQLVTLVDEAPTLSVSDFTIVTAESSITVDYADYPDKISATDVLDGNSVAILCTPTTLVLGANSVSCTATDSAGNEDTKSLTVTVELSYVIRIDPPKGNIRAGSTVPIDFRYLDRASGQPIDSAGFSPSATWAGYSDSGCMTPNGRSMGSDDAGSSSFRYGFPTWQYSWQTPSDASGSYLLFTVKPPNAPTKESSICVRIR